MNNRIAVTVGCLALLAAPLAVLAAVRSSDSTSLTQVAVGGQEVPALDATTTTLEALPSAPPLDLDSLSTMTDEQFEQATKGLNDQQKLGALILRKQAQAHQMVVYGPSPDHHGYIDQRSPRR